MVGPDQSKDQLKLAHGGSDGPKAWNGPSLQTTTTTRPTSIPIHMFFYLFLKVNMNVYLYFKLI